VIAKSFRFLKAGGLAKISQGCKPPVLTIKAASPGGGCSEIRRKCLRPQRKRRKKHVSASVKLAARNFDASTLGKSEFGSFGLNRVWREFSHSLLESKTNFGTPSGGAAEYFGRHPFPSPLPGLMRVRAVSGGSAGLHHRL
jgi:hypothetical protein